jgi:hypothetical protein
MPSTGDSQNAQIQDLNCDQKKVRAIANCKLKNAGIGVASIGGFGVLGGIFGGPAGAVGGMVVGAIVGAWAGMDCNEIGEEAYRECMRKCETTQQH